MADIDVSRVLIETARAAGVVVYESLPDDVTKRLPCVVLEELGDVGLRPDFHERAGYSYSGFAATKAGAKAVTQAARRAWFAAANLGAVTAGGRMGFFRDDVHPYPIDTGMSGVFRAVGTCTVSARP